MTSIVFKISDKIPKKRPGDRTSTARYSLDQSMQIMDGLLDRIDAGKLPSASAQLKDV